MTRLLLLLFMILSLAGCGTLAASGAGGNSSQYGFNNDSSVPSDASISANIRRQLINQPDINASRISVSTQRGVVSLEGRVASTAQRDRIIDLCQQTAGVKQVRSNLRVDQD